MLRPLGVREVGVVVVVVVVVGGLREVEVRGYGWSRQAVSLIDLTLS